MQYRDFVTDLDYLDIKSKINGREMFEYKRTVKVSDGEVSFGIKSDYTKNVQWWGTDYIFHFNVDVRRRNNIGGCGFAESKTEILKSAETFKGYLEDMLFSRLDRYDMVEEGQMCLW